MPSHSLNKSLEALFISKVRLKLLEVFLINPGSFLYVRELVRLVDEEVNAVRRELTRLQKIGMLRSEERANRLYYQLRTDFTFYPELLRMFAKTTDLGGSIVSHAGELGKIKHAVLSAAFVKGRVARQYEIDLLVIGRVQVSVLDDIVKEAQRRHGHEVNYTIMTEEEFAFRKSRRDPFVMAFLQQTWINLIGDEEELVKLEKQ
jgi:hypothetical protein